MTHVSSTQAAQVSAAGPIPGSLAGPGLRICEVRKRFGDNDVLNGIDLEVWPGEVVALLGPNGAGKSTLLRIILGTVAADAGEIVIAGHSVRHDPIAARASVSWVIGDEHGWYWRLTGLENLVFFAMVRGAPYGDAQARAIAELERQGLEHAAKKRVGQYSTGMRARLALARASLAPTAAMVLDEPGQGLDVAANERLAQFIGGRVDTAVLLVTHDLEIVSRVATRSVVLDRGEVRAQLPGGTPADALATTIVPGGWI